MSFLSHDGAEAYTFRHPGHGVRESETKVLVMSRGLAVLVSIVVFTHTSLAALDLAQVGYGAWMFA
jgi:hypothetical protein